jgi:hypothetical protein
MNPSRDNDMHGTVEDSVRVLLLVASSDQLGHEAMMAARGHDV